MAREEIRIGLEAEDDASRTIEDVADAADDLEATRVELPIDADAAGAVAELDRVEDKARHAEAAVRDIGPAATPGVSAIADLTGPLGDASASAGELGESVASTGELAGALATKFGASAAQASALQAAMGPIALAVAAAAAAWTFYRQGQAEAKQRAEELLKVNKEIIASLREGDAAAAAGALVEGYDDVLQAAGAAGVSIAEATRFITGQSDAMGVLTGRAADVTTAEGATVIMLGRARDAYADATAATDATAAATADAQGALEELADPLVQAKLRAEELTRAYEDLQGTLADESSLLSARQAIDDVEQAFADALLATSEFGEGSEEAQDANLALQQQLNAAKRDVIAYAEQVGGIPPEALTEIEALIDEGRLADAEAKLAALEHKRTVTVDVAKGTGWADVIPWFGRGGATTNVTINAPRGTRPAELLAAGDAYARRNGRR